MNELPDEIPTPILDRTTLLRAIVPDPVVDDLEDAILGELQNWAKPMPGKNTKPPAVMYINWPPDGEDSVTYAYALIDYLVTVLQKMALVEEEKLAEFLRRVVKGDD